MTSLYLPQHASFFSTVNPPQITCNKDNSLKVPLQRTGLQSEGEEKAPHGSLSESNDQLHTLSFILFLSSGAGPCLPCSQSSSQPETEVGWDPTIFNLVLWEKEMDEEDKKHYGEF